jgi:hypothetical protein
MVRDLRRTGRVFGGSGGSDPISEAKWEAALCQ